MVNKIFGQPWYLWVVLALAVGYVVYPPETVMVNNLMSQFQGAQQGVTPVTTQGAMTANPGNPYTKAISLTVTTTWAYDDSNLGMNGDRFQVYHHDLSTVANGNVTVTAGVGTAATITQLAGDNGLLYLVHDYNTQTTGFIDRDLTVSRNAPFLTGWMLRDIDNDGIMDIVFTLDVSMFPDLAGGQTTQPVALHIFAWRSQAAITMTAISSPTGMTTAGDYHVTGYFSAWTGEGYQLRLVKAQIGTSNSGSTAVTANATIGALFVAGTLQLKGLTLSDVKGKYTQVYSTVPYDAANSWFLLYSANYNGATDPTQAEYGTNFIYQRQAGASWMGYDIWLHSSSGAMTAANKYYAIIYLTFINPAGTNIITYVVLTLTG